MHAYHLNNFSDPNKLLKFQVISHSQTHNVAQFDHYGITAISRLFSLQKIAHTLTAADRPLADWMQCTVFNHSILHIRIQILKID